MKLNEFLGAGLILVIVFAFFIQYVIVPSGAATASGWFTFDGLLMMFFGVWGGLRLLKQK